MPTCQHRAERPARILPLLRLAGWLLLLLAGWCVVAHGVQAQTATVRGFITDEDGQALLGVNVILRGAAEALLGAATDAEGFFIVTRIPPGRYTFDARFIGFETYTDTLTLAIDDSRTLNIQLRLAETELGEVVVETERQAGAAQVTAGLQRIRPQDIELIPAPDVSADLVNYLTTLPGVVASGDRGGQLFIRGGEPTQNLVLLDGMLVYQPFHILGFYSAFPADLVRNADVYAGGFGARYGERLSSVIDVSTRNGNNRRLSGALTVAPFVSSARIEGPLVPGRASFLGSARQSFIEEGAANLVDENLPYRFGDLFGKLHLLLNQNSQVSITALRTYDRGVVGVDEATADLDAPDQDQIRWENQAVGLRYVLLPTALPMFAELVFSHSELLQEFGLRNAPRRSTNTTQYTFSANVTYYTPRTDVHWGLQLRSSQFDNELGGQFQNVDEETLFVTEAAAYVEPEIRLGAGLTVNLGFRAQAFPSSSLTFLEPRLRLILQRGIHQLNGAWGIYHQEITGLNDRRDAGDIFTAWTVSPFGAVPKAMHSIVGYQLTTGGLDVSVEGFYKDLSDLFIPEWTAFPRFTSRLQPADGTALGFDVRVGYTGSWFSGFVTYGYADVEYEARGRAIPIWYGVEGEPFNPPHDRRHQISAVGSVSFFGFDLNVRWQYGSGLPFSQSLGFDKFILNDPEADVTQDPGSLRVLYGPPYRGRLPAYHRLDVSLDRTFRTGRAAVTLQAGLINTYDRNNLFYMDLFTLKRADQLPLIPSIGLKLAWE